MVCVLIDVGIHFQIEQYPASKSATVIGENEGGNTWLPEQPNLNKDFLLPLEILL